MNNNQKKEEKNICDILKFEGIMSQGFGVAPRIIMRDKRLSVEAKAIYCYLQSFAGSSEKAFPSRQTMLDELGMSKNRYYKYLRQLTDYGYIKIERIIDENGWKKGNIYVIVANPEVKEVIPAADQEDIKPIKADKQKARKKQRSPLYQQLKIAELIDKYPDDKNIIKQIYRAAEDIEKSEEIKIGGSVKKKEAISDLLEQLSDKNVIAVLKAVRDNKSSIRNMRLWIQTCLHNSTYETDEELNKKIDKYDKARCKHKKSSSLAEVIFDVQKSKPEEDPHISKAKRQINNILAKRAKAQIIGDVRSIEKYDVEIKKIESDIQSYL